MRLNFTFTTLLFVCHEKISQLLAMMNLIDGELTRFKITQFAFWSNKCSPIMKYSADEKRREIDV